MQVKLTDPNREDFENGILKVCKDFGPPSDFTESALYASRNWPTGVVCSGAGLSISWAWHSGTLTVYLNKPGEP